MTVFGGEAASLNGRMFFSCRYSFGILSDNSNLSVIMCLLGVNENFCKFCSFALWVCGFLFDGWRAGCFTLRASLNRKKCERVRIFTGYSCTKI